MNTFHVSSCEQLRTAEAFLVKLGLSKAVSFGGHIKTVVVHSSFDTENKYFFGSRRQMVV